MITLTVDANMIRSAYATLRIHWVSVTYRQIPTHTHKKKTLIDTNVVTFPLTTINLSADMVWYNLSIYPFQRIALRTMGGFFDVTTGN